MPLPRKQKQIAGLVALLVPYWLWVSFACVPNYFVWHLNPQVWR